MPKPATGNVRWVGGVAVARITVVSDRREDFRMPSCTTEADARERSKLLASIAKRLRLATADEETKRKALELVAAATARTLHNAVAVIEDLIGGKLVPISRSAAPTFKEVAERWTNGELARQYPDQVREKRSVSDDVSRFTNYIYPVIGHLPIDALILDHFEEVMRRLPATLQPATRRNVGQLMTRLMRLAVYPLRLITASPIPSGFLPAAGKQKAFAYLYPDEDRRLLGCAGVALDYRMLWGFLTREGCREGEALELAWSDLDLERGAIRLDKNKTDDPRAWALDAGVARALRLYREHVRGADKPTDRVFVGPKGGELVGPGLAELLRKHLTMIGLDKERPELFTSNAERRRLRVHDLRGTFVTVSLSNGRSESWIADRTGHRSSNMIARYKRTARTFSELQCGDFTSLDNAIPEVSEMANRQAFATRTAKSSEPWRPQRELNPCYQRERLVS
jgi:integrase